VVLDTDAADAAGLFERITGIESVTRVEKRFTIRGRGEDLVTEVIHCLSENGIRVTDFRTVLPTLEDVFLKLTGRSIRE
jgi:ABC-2 type transport system ATP-binding protein